MSTPSNPLPGAQPVPVEGEYLVSGVVWRATADALEAQLQEARALLLDSLAVARCLRQTIRELPAATRLEFENNQAITLMATKYTRRVEAILAKHPKPAPTPAPSSPPPSRG